MLDAKLADLLEGLSESEYVPSQALAGHCGISDRTVRTRVQELREELERNGATNLGSAMVTVWWCRTDRSTRFG